MTVQEKIEQAVDRASLTWATVMTVATIATLVLMPFWYTIFLVPFGLVTYFGFMTLTVAYLSSSITPEEVNAMTEDDSTEKIKALHVALENGTIEPGSDEMFSAMQDAGLEMKAVTAVSDELIGHFRGAEIREWVELVDPFTNKVERFTYDFVLRGPDDLSMMADTKKSYANIQEVVYSRTR